jgi:CheY-like chemotaxis protein
MTAASQFQYKCILLIDDDKITNTVNLLLLDKINVAEKVHSTTGAKDALDYIMRYSALNDSKSPELILLDINMPGIDGFEFLEMFDMIYFKNREDIKVIFLTTSTDPQDIDRIYKKLKLTSILKPLTEEKFQNAIRA